jgi:hypothetical protein
MKPVIPPTIEAVIANFDQGDGPIDELQVKAALAAARQELVNPSDAENLGAWAEVLAFALVETRQHSSPWNTYFGPIGSGTKENGEPFYSPDIAGTDAEVVAHWIARAQSIKHPVLKARYADLAWDMSRAIAKSNPDPDMARMAIDAYLASISTGFRRDIHDEFESAIRALDLSEMLRDTGRIDAARTALLLLHAKAVEKAQGLWWKAFDRLIDDKHARLADHERDQLIADLEVLAARFSNNSDPKVFDPHAAQSASERLIAYYNRIKKRDEAARLHQLTARSFEHAASLADPMLASAFLETAVAAYRDARLHDQSKRARVLMEEKIAASREQMQTFKFETTITTDDMEKFLAMVVVEDIGSTFVRIASKFVHARKKLEAEVENLMENSPLLAMITQTVMAEKHVAAKVGSVEDDPFGRLIQQATQSISFNDIWLMAALDRAIEVHGLTPHHFVGWAARTGLFDDLHLLMEGVRAWFAGDFVKAVHVLIPQVETALRAIAAKLGKPTTKAHPKIAGVSVAVNMGDLLYSPEVTDALGSDITLHLLTLYADPRGFNLRNDMAHGLLTADQMGNSVATRLMHTLLVLGIWDQLAEARKAQSSNQPGA